MAAADRKGMFPINGEIVIVEDDDILRPLIVDILAEIQAKSVAFTTADEALTHAVDSHEHCSILITDHGVPGHINGTELAAIFRTKWPQISVILTSGYELAPEKLPAGVAYLQKPWTVNQLIETITKVLQLEKPATDA